ADADRAGLRIRRAAVIAAAPGAERQGEGQQRRARARFPDERSQNVHVAAPLRMEGNRPRAFTRRQHRRQDVIPAIAPPAAIALYSAARRARGTASAAVLSPTIGVRAERVPPHAGPSRKPLPYGNLTRRDRPPAQLPRR